MSGAIENLCELLVDRALEFFKGLSSLFLPSDLERFERALRNRVSLEELSGGFSRVAKSLKQIFGDRICFEGQIVMLLPRGKELCVGACILEEFQSPNFLPAFCCTDVACSSDFYIDLSIFFLVEQIFPPSKNGFDQKQIRTILECKERLLLRAMGNMSIAAQGDCEHKEWDEVFKMVENLRLYTSMVDRDPEEDESPNYQRRVVSLRKVVEVLTLRVRSGEKSTWSDSRNLLFQGVFYYLHHLDREQAWQKHIEFTIRHLHLNAGRLRAMICGLEGSFNKLNSPYENLRLLVEAIKRLLP